ncbi:hypothetical protein [Geodermatophilus poikilotrophus]|nr:hypothetical protein [Geodermatophilus poikilotrophus]
MLESSQDDDLHRLLIFDYGGRNAWFEARAAASELNGYRLDILRARKRVRNTEPHSDCGRTLDLRYALIQASVRAAIARIKPALLDSLLDARVWNLQTAYGHVHGITNPQDRVRALCIVAGYDDKEGQASSAQEALDLARSTADERTLATAILGLLPLLPHASKRPLIEELLEHLTLSAGSRVRSETLQKLAPFLCPFPDLVSTAENKLRALPTEPPPLMLEGYWHDPDEEAELVRQRDESRLDEARLEEIQNRLAFCIAAPARERHLLSASIALAAEMDEGFYLRTAIDHICTRLSNQGTLLHKLLVLVESISDPTTKCAALGSVAPLLVGSARESAVNRALVIAKDLGGDGPSAFDRLKVIAKVAPILAPERRLAVLREALDLVAQLRGQRMNHHLALKELAPHIGEEASLLECALALLEPQDPLGGSSCASAVTALAGSMSAQSGFIERCIETAQSIPDPTDRADAISGVSRHIPAPRRAALLRMALSDLSQIGDDHAASRAFAGLAVVAADPSNVSRVEYWCTSLPSGGLRADVLTALGQHLPEPHKDDALTKAVAEARREQAIFGYAYGMAKIAEVSTPGKLAPELLEALHATQDGYDIGFGFVDAAMALAPAIARCDEKTLTEALAFLCALPSGVRTGPDPRPFALCGFVPHVPNQVRKQVIEFILNFAPRYEETSPFRHHGRLELISAVAPYLADTPDLAQRTLELAVGFRGARQRGTALIRTLGSIAHSPSLVELAFRAVLELPTHTPAGSNLRSEALIAAVPVLANFPALMEEARRVLEAEADVSLALQMKVALLVSDQAQGVTKICEDLLDSIMVVPHPMRRVSILAELCPFLESDQSCRAARVALRAATSLSGHSRFMSFMALSRFASGSKAVAAAVLDECGKTTDTMRRPALLACLTNSDVFSNESARSLLGEAFTVVLATNDSNARREMLRALSPHLARVEPGEQWRRLVDLLGESNRGERLGDLGAAVEVLASVGGANLALALADEVVRARRWWP